MKSTTEKQKDGIIFGILSIISLIFWLILQIILNTFIGLFFDTSIILIAMDHLLDIFYRFIPSMFMWIITTIILFIYFNTYNSIYVYMLNNVFKTFEYKNRKLLCYSIFFAMSVLNLIKALLIK